MTRSEKGRVAPAPRLAPQPQRVADVVGAHDGVVVQAHWQIGSQTQVNGTDFYVGEEELGHIHLDGEAHVPLGGRLVDVVVAAGLAGRFRWSRAFAAVDATDDGRALFIFELRRAQIAGVDASILLQRIADRATS